MIAWLIYGNVIYFSDENNCKEFEQTKALSGLMLFFLVLGYFQFLTFGAIICILPCLIFYLARAAQQQENAN